MSHLWMSLENQWQAVLLDGSSFTLRGAAPDKLQRRDPGTEPGNAAILQRCPGNGGSEEWMLLVPANAIVRVNGYPVPLGARALRDQDEIAVGGAAPIYFSTEQRTVVEPFPGTEPVDCPRCSKPIQPGVPAARCPCCQIWYHQLPDRSCFTYAEACTTCGGETALSEEFRWSPELL